MTATLQGAQTPSQAGFRSPSLQAPALPQVNLLPPEVRAARALARTKLWLAFAVLVTLLACAGLVVKAMLDQQDAAAQLDEAKAETARLQAQQERYAEVPVVRAELERATSARQLVMATEIMWWPHLDAIAAKTPPGARIESLKVLGSSSWAGAFAPTDALAPVGAATIGLTGQTVTLADVYTWQRSLEELPGVAEVVMSQTALVDGTTMLKYNVTATITLSEDAYSGRFLAQTEAEGE